MKKLLIILLLSPFFTFAQNIIIDLKSYGLNATLSDPNGHEYKIEKETDDGTTVYSIHMGEDKIKINDYPKPMTAKQVMSIYLGMPKTKSKSSSFRILEKGPNRIIMEANYSGAKRYTFFYSVVAKGKQIVVEGTSEKDLESCKMLQKIGESFKLN